MVWTKVFAPILKILHNKRDLYLPISRQRQQATIAVPSLASLKDVLLNAGFVMNLKKSEMVPTQTLVYASAPTMEFPLCHKIWFQGRMVTAHVFQHLLGLMVSMVDIILCARLHMRPLQTYLKRHWCQGEDLLIKGSQFQEIFLSLDKEEEYIQGVTPNTPNSHSRTV